MSSVKVVLPTLDLNQIDNPLAKVVIKGNKQFTTNTLNADTESANQVLFSFQPPSQNTIIDRRFLLEAQFQITNTKPFASNLTIEREKISYVVKKERGGNANTLKVEDLNADLDAKNVGDNGNDGDTTGSLYVRRDQNFCPRQMPLMSVIEVIDLEINGTHISVSPKDYIHALLRYTTPDFRMKYLTGSASYPDLVSNYLLSYGKANSNFSIKGSNGRKGENPRGYCSPRKAEGNNNLIYTFTEPLFISPLLMGGEFEGLTNVNQININIRWDTSKINRVMSWFDPDVDATDTPPTTNEMDIVSTAETADGYIPSTSAVAIVDGSCKLKINYYTPQDDIKIPNEVVYPYKQPQNYIKSYTSQGIANLATSSLLTGDNIRINQIPECVYLFVNKPRNSKTLTDADHHYPITQVSVNWNNQNSLLSNATAVQLHQINKDNGLDADFWEVGGMMNNASKGVHYGTPLCLKFGKDIPLETGETAGMVGNYNLRIDVAIQNTEGISSATLDDFEVNTLLIMNGACIVSPNEMRLTLGNVDNADAMGASDKLDHSEVSRGIGGLEGGSLWSSAKHLVKRGGRVAKKLAEACDKYAPAMKKMGDMSGGGYDGGNYAGGNYMGGRR